MFRGKLYAQLRPTGLSTRARFLAIPLQPLSSVAIPTSRSVRSVWQPSEANLRSYSQTSIQASPNFSKRSKKKAFLPRKAAVGLTDESRSFFKRLLENVPDKAGIILNYQQASSGQPRMVFSFAFVTEQDLAPEDEEVSLELKEDGTPLSPRESHNDGLQKLYIHHNALMKVLGATVDVNTETIAPILYDREGHIMDPNA